LGKQLFPMTLCLDDLLLVSVVLLLSSNLLARFLPAIIAYSIAQSRPGSDMAGVPMHACPP
jgi:hypothetical protein